MKSLHIAKTGWLWCLPFVLISCSKIRDVGSGGSTNNQQDFISTSATLHVNQSYEYDLSIANSVVITRQALHYIVSTSYRSGGRLVYRYVPASNFSGQDGVELQIQTGTAGTNLKITNIAIYFDIY